MIETIRPLTMFWFLVSPFVFGQVGSASVSLLRDGRSEHRIVLSPEASNSEKHAARELQLHFKACTGVELPIVHATPKQNVPMIVLGRGPAAESLGVHPEDATLGEQGSLLRTVGPHLVIAGTREVGTLYGVHRFLEKYLGVRWYAPGVTKTPTIRNLVIEKTDQVIRPAFLYRQTSYTRPGRDADYLARMGDNAGGGGPDSPHGTQYAFDGRAHSYFRFIRPDEFFDTHPEYFSEKGGVRLRTETQLCLTNPDVLRIVTERMLERMKADPTVRQHNFSQMDYYNYCQCKNCRAMNERLGTTGGTQFWFVNQVAKRTAKVYPDKLIGTLAYTFTEEPPKGLTMHPNVAVWLCHMFPSCDSHPIATCPRNADYKRRAQRWSERCSHLYVWHYVVDFAHYYNPFPNFRAMAADMKFYRDIGVEGVYLQGMGHGGGGGEFSLLRPYYGMKLLWNPDQDPDAILTDFLQGYYGAAWKPIRKYVRLLHDKVEKENIHMHLYTNPAQGYLPDSAIRQSEALFDQAENLVKNDAELLERVRVARMPLVYARLFPRNGYKIHDSKLTWVGPLASTREAIDFVGRMKTHGFATVREYGGDPSSLIPLSMMLAMAQKVYTIRNEHLSVDIVPILGGRALRITHRPTGQCVTAHNVRRNLYFPFSGGLEHRVGEIFRSYGWMEPARVVRHDERSITLKSRTMDGHELTRSLVMDPNRPALHVEAKLTNTGTKPAQLRLRSHLELDLGDLRKTRIELANPAGSPRIIPAQEILARLREGEHFYETDLSPGRWSFVGNKGLRVVQKFDPQEIDFAWVYAYPEELGELEAELWAKRKTVPAGQSVTLYEEIEVLSVR